MEKKKSTLLKILLLILAVCFALPLYITIVNVFKETKEIAASPMSLPLPPTISNIVSVLKSPNVDIGKMYMNSILITVFGAGICIFLSSLAAYYIARVKSRFSNLLYVYFLFGLMVPYVIVYVPLVTMFNKVGLTGNLPGLIMVFVSGSISFSVFMYQGFISGISVELEEAAIIDGAGDFTIYWRIVMPLVKPCTTTVAIFIGLSMWNDFLTPLLIGQIKTITVSFLGKIYDVSLLPKKKIVGLYIMNIPLSQLEASLNIESGLGQGQIYLVNSSNQIVYTTTREECGKQFQKNIASIGKRTYASEKKLGSSELIVEYILSEKILFSQINHIRNQIMIVLTISIIVTLGFSYLIYKVFQKKMNMLLASMEKVQHGNFKARLPVETQDEIGRISMSFNEMCDKLNIYVEQVYKSEIQRKNAEINALQTQIDPHFLYNTLESIKAKALSNNDEDAAEMIVCIITNISSINTDLEIKELLEGLLSLIAKKMQREMFFAVGRPVRTYRGLSTAFQEAEETLQYKFIFEQAKVLFADEIKAYFENENVIAEVKQQDIEALLEKTDNEEIQNYLDTLFGAGQDKIVCMDYYVIRNMAMEMIVYLYHLLSTKMIMERADIGKKKEKALQELVSVRTLNCMKEFLFSIIIDAKKQYQRYNSSSYSKITQDVICYVKENYGNAELSLQYLADLFHVNTAYLGRVFKKETGASFVDYLNIYRIEEATKLLKNTNLKGSELCERVGYSNYNYFYIVFKKITGKKPMEIRNYTNRE